MPYPYEINIPIVTPTPPVKEENNETDLVIETVASAEQVAVEEKPLPAECHYG